MRICLGNDGKISSLRVLQAEGKLLLMFTLARRCKDDTQAEAEAIIRDGITQAVHAEESKLAIPL